MPSTLTTVATPIATPSADSRVRTRREDSPTAPVRSWSRTLTFDGFMRALPPPESRVTMPSRISI